MIALALLRSVAPVLLAAAAAATVPWQAAAQALLEVERIAAGLDSPLFATSPPGDSRRVFIVERGGTIRIYDRDARALVPQPFLDIPALGEDHPLSAGGERGLLGLAFHPRFAENGVLYVNATRLVDGELTTEITRYVAADPAADAPIGAPGTPVLRYGQPQGNHNGGWIGFDPTAAADDAWLYVAAGDGGSADDPHGPIGNGQSLTTPLGKILRIDVDGDDFPADAARNYAIPAGNPQRTGVLPASALPEIWAYGLRNPWRCSFDRATGDLFIGDVGQNAWEEIDRIPAGSGGGQNFGWRLREGFHATPSGGVGGDRPADNVDPIYEYPHGGGSDEGISVTGGYVHRGPIAALRGRYVFGDFVTARVWAIDPDGGGFADLTDALRPDAGTIGQIASFGEDADGNLYVVDLGGEVFRVAARDAGSASAWLLPLLVDLVE